VDRGKGTVISRTKRRGKEEKGDAWGKKKKSVRRAGRAQNPLEWKKTRSGRHQEKEGEDEQFESLKNEMKKKKKGTVPKVSLIG